MDYLENHTFDEIKVGDSDSLTRTLTEKDIQVFAIMSGDINPAHVDAEFAQSDMFHKIIGHGMWGGALISTVLGTQLPGPGTLYVSQSLHFKKPVALHDTITVTVTALEKKPEKNRVVFSCCCRNQHNDIVIEGNAEVIAPTKKIRRLKTVMPQISLRRQLSLFDPYVAKAKKIGAISACVIHPVHRKIIEAVHHAFAAKLIDPILVGPKQRILHALQEANVKADLFTIIDAENSLDAINKSIAMARAGEVGMLIRGAAIREDLLHAMQKHDKGLMTDRELSYVAVLDVPTYPKALIMSDTLVHIDPHLDQKRSITQNAIEFALSLGIAQPKVAILSGVDTINYNMRSTIDAAALCKMAERGQIRHGILDGPLTFDHVISIEDAKEKGIQSPVIGDADILIMPNVETGNMLVEQLEHLAEAKIAGLLLGARVPVLMSRINDVELSTVSCALAILNTHYQSLQSPHQT